MEFLIVAAVVALGMILLVAGDLYAGDRGLSQGIVTTITDLVKVMGGALIALAYAKKDTRKDSDNDDSE